MFCWIFLNKNGAKPILHPNQGGNIKWEVIKIILLKNDIRQSSREKEIVYIMRLLKVSLGREKRNRIRENSLILLNNAKKRFMSTFIIAIISVFNINHDRVPWVTELSPWFNNLTFGVRSLSYLRFSLIHYFFWQLEQKKLFLCPITKLLIFVPHLGQGLSLLPYTNNSCAK